MKEISKLEAEAQAFAAFHHSTIDHRRKYTNLPYITHPAAVVEIVRGVTSDPEMLAAAWLHDTVEDTKATLEMIRADFGPAVAELVADLTDVSKPEDGSRARRKALDREHTAKASPRAKTIKLADLIDNATTILECDRKFARVYIPEKIALMGVLKEGNPRLWVRASEIIAGTERIWARPEGFKT